MPWAIASLPDAHADTGVCTPALAPIARPTFAAGLFGISIGTASGETRRGPFSLQRVVVGQQRRDATDARGHRHAETLRVDVLAVRARRRPRLQRGDHRELSGPVQPSRLDPLEHLGRLHGDPRGDPDRQFLRPVLGEMRTPDVPASMASQVVGTSPPRGSSHRVR